MQSMYAWLRRHPKVVDAGLAALPCTLGLSTTASSPSAGTALAFVVCVPLVWRRRYPVAVLLWVYAVGACQLLFGFRARLSDLAVIIVIYTVSAYGPRWAVAAAVPAGVLGGVLADLTWTHAVDTSTMLVGMGALIAPVILAWAIGENMRTRRAYLSELEQRAVRLERERDAQARAAAAEERARIARELHDVVAHSVSVIVVQADGADAALRDDALDDVGAAIDAIGRTGRSALAELRLMLGVLREADSDGAPQPDEAQIVNLVDRAPLPTRLINEGTTRCLPPGLGLTAYRIVQEALTNAIKHAGPKASAVVRLRYDTDALRIEVDDDGRGPAPTETSEHDHGHGGGHGLVGMRERASMFGGTVVAGPRPGGGFQVRADLPIEPTSGANH